MRKRRVFVASLACLYGVIVLHSESVYALIDAGAGEVQVGDIGETVPETTVMPMVSPPIVVIPTQAPVSTEESSTGEVEPDGETQAGGDKDGNGETVEEGAGGGTIINITKDCECIGVLNKILLELQKSSPSVTALYSVNRRIADCYYRPAYEEVSSIVDIAAEVSLRQKFAAVYTGYFDLYDPELGQVGEYKPKASQCRELEILGYDFLLAKEDYDIQSRKYLATLYEDDYVTWEIAVMDLYKALGKEILSYDLFFEDDKNDEEPVSLSNSPIASSLPSYVSSLDTSRVKTYLFITRTYSVDGYYKRAVEELSVSARYRKKYITNGDFIILVADAMKLYGEPVMSEMEMKLLLQVYGGEIPEYLNEEERDAYLYLKARGVLNLDLDFMNTLEFQDMLNILMCVKDINSRTDFKSIQVTFDIGEELINLGYFPKTVTIVDKNAIQVEEQHLTEQELAEGVDYYDYLIRISRETTFYTEDGNLVGGDSLFIAKINGENEQGEREGTEFLGELEYDGAYYYHFRVAKNFSGVLEINTTGTLDKPYYLRIPKAQLGGGVYEYSKGSSKVTLKRVGGFQDIEGLLDKYNLWDKQRVNSASKRISVMQSLFAFLFPTVTAVADTVNPVQANTYYQGRESMSLVKLLVYGMDHAEQYTGSAACVKSITENGDGSCTIVTYSNCRDYVLSMIDRDEEKNVMCTAICNLAGDVLVDYDVLVQAGVFYNDYGNQVPTPDDVSGQVLRLTGYRGQVKLNNETREVIVGNVIYKLKNVENEVLFKFLEERGEQKLYVDFRAAYGWTAEDVKITCTGTGSGYQINITDRSSENLELFTTVNIRPVKAFATGRDNNLDYAFGTYIDVIPGNAVAECTQPSLLLTSSYPLANWIMYQGVNPENGSAEEYLYVYYLKAAMGSEIPDGVEKLKSRLGYAVCDEELWCIREFKVSDLVEQGQLKYVDGLGYIFVLRPIEELSLEDYLTGKVVLPIGYDESSNCLRNMNVSLFTGCDYGIRPVGKAGECVTVGGEIIVATSAPALGDIVPAPVGVAAYYGGGSRQYTVLGNSMLAAENESGTVFYGINRCVVDMDADRNQVVKLSWGNYLLKEVTDPNVKLYIAGIGSTSLIQQNDLRLRTCYVITNAELTTVIAEKPIVADIVVESADVVDAERTDVYMEYKQFRIENLLSAIDQGTSTLLVLVFTVFPMVGVCLLTVLVGFVLAADYKGVRVFAEKVFDPVMILTFGKRRMSDFQLKDCIFSMLVGYTLFALLYDGNLFRVLSKVFELYEEAVRYLKYL